MQAIRRPPVVLKKARAFPLMLCLTVFFPTLSMAINDIPEQSGWSGFVFFGAGYSDLKSNTVAGNNFVDFDNEVTTSLTSSPRADEQFHPVVNGEANYTFGDRWQAFIGTSIEDAITLDLTQQAGLRKQFDNSGIFQLSFLFSGTPQKVYEDPYLLNTKRADTNRNSNGARFQWDRIFGSKFEFTAQYRDIDIDNDLNGISLVDDPGAFGITAAEQLLLRRDGDVYSTSLAYLHAFSPKHIIRPLIAYKSADTDGDAEAFDELRAQLTYTYMGAKYTFVGNASYSSNDFDQRNPIYDEFRDSDALLLQGQVFYRLPTESGRWTLVGSFLWGDADSDINFHDNNYQSASVGAIYRFGQAPVLRGAKQAP